MIKVRRIVRLLSIPVLFVVLVACDGLLTPPGRSTADISVLELGRGEANSFRFSWTLTNPEDLSVHCSFDPGDGTPVHELPGCQPGWVDHKYLPQDGFHEVGLSLYVDNGLVATRTYFLVTGYTAPPEDFVAEMLAGVNEMRSQARQCGVLAVRKARPVTWNELLEAAAQGHSDWMAETETQSHTGRNGSDPGSRISAVGYNWGTYGENVASYFPSVERVLAAFMNSPAHCRNIMRGDVSDFGAAVALTDAGIPYWTQLFARPR